MKKVQIVAALLQMFIVLPIWFYLLYKILFFVNASELMWFLFWIYIPLDMFVFFIFRVFTKN